MKTLSRLLEECRNNNNSCECEFFSFGANFMGDVCVARLENSDDGITLNRYFYADKSRLARMINDIQKIKGIKDLEIVAFSELTFGKIRPCLRMMANYKNKGFWDKIQIATQEKIKTGNIYREKYILQDTDLEKINHAFQQYKTAHMLSGDSPMFGYGKTGEKRRLITIEDVLHKEYFKDIPTYFARFYIRDIFMHYPVYFRNEIVELVLKGPPAI